MFTFQLTPKYLPNGRIDDYKKKYGERFGELIIATLSYQDIQAVMSVSSDTERVYAKIKHPVSQRIVDKRYNVPDLLTIESILFHAVRQSFPNITFPFESNNHYLSFLIFTEEKAELKIHSVYTQLLDDISDAFPFQLRYTIKPDRNEIDIIVYYACSDYEQKKIFSEMVNERLHETFKDFDRVNYFDW
ncbi:hypothetical protein JMA_39790 (plasmid) [Jeotgalibacillus malaysiensis]|uniref:Uncharacterized protein n=1 Tax=Jeotgalibacillus malaysiensis TaxID=1508404 RepID=A0A0B5AX83_9BACL|nr:hypothetical protein [Jeotgalibacillus malaysiensis]AJD93297.1 hypothetical protein JMA_39790 [Jeotgalibacillus malaysiensis]